MSSKTKKNGVPAKLCLNMIVKNEAHVVDYAPMQGTKIPVIQRCLENIGHLIDAIAIVDTGSTDKTIEVINEWAEKRKIPCEVKVEPWRDDFGYSRTYALRFGQIFIEKIKTPEDEAPWYFLFMDADNLAWAADGKSPFPIDKSSLTLDAYRAPMRMGGVEYGYVFLVKVDPKRPWQWYCPVHEYVSEVKDKENKPIWRATYGELKGGFIDSRREGSRSHNNFKYVGDAVAFEKHLMGDPMNDRYLYYVAQSWRDAGKEFINQARAEKEKSNNPVLTQEERNLAMMKYNQLILRAGMMLDRCEKAFVYRASAPPFNMMKDEYTYYSWLEAARIRKSRKNNKVGPKVIQYLSKAFQTRPNRLEAPYELIKYYKSIDAWTLAWTIAKDLIHAPYPKDDIIFVDKDIHLFLFNFEASLCAYYAGDKQEFIRLTNKVIKCPETSPEIRRIAQDNLDKFGK